MQRILDPLTADEFVEKYFQRRPLRLSGPREKFDFLFRADDFASNLDRVSQIRAVFPQSRQARIHPAEIEAMYKAGATICITGMEQAHPKLRNVAQRVRAELNYAGSVSFRAYLSPPGSGFGLHFDARVATTLQISGRKRWWYSKRPEVPFPPYNSGRGPAGSPRYRPPALRTMQSVVLQPGDVLCLPAGVWHCAKGEGKDMSLALNMAFDHSGAGVFDSIMSVLQQRLTKDPQWRAPLPAVPGNRRRGIPESVSAVLREHIDTLLSELAALRHDEAELMRAWRMVLRAKQPL